MNRLRLPLLAALVVLFAFVLACGKDDSSSTSSAPLGVSESLDMEKVAEAMQGLKSFRFDMVMKLDIGSRSGSTDPSDAFAALLLGALGDIKASGAYVAPDQMEMTMTILGQEMGYVEIGSRAWVKMGGSWQATPPSGLGFDFASPTDLFNDVLPAQALTGARTSREKVNGVDTVRYSFDRAALESAAQALGESTADFADLTEMSLDIWISGDGIPVKLTLDASGRDESGQRMGIRLEVNLRDINSDSIRIRPPV
jgi:hypothetical protein